MGSDRTNSLPTRRRLALDISETPTYAIGDVHGCYDQLIEMEERLVADASRLPGRKLIIMLGDFIDRGPYSARVIAHLMRPPPADFDRICLTGNHEIAMLAYVDDEMSLESWLQLGAEKTLNSYGLDPTHLERQYPSQKNLDAFIRGSLPADHIDFLRDLPILVETPTALFVHAGIDPELPIAEQSEADLVFIRSRFFNSPLALPKLIIHGHTPVKAPETGRLRLNIDTGAFATGKLTAARLWGGRVHVTST